MVSERRACRVLSQPRMTQRYEATRPDDEERLVARMRGLAAKHPRYGYRRIWALLRREGWSINRKRVHRCQRRCKNGSYALSVKRIISWSDSHRNLGPWRSSRVARFSPARRLFASYNRHSR